MKRGKLYALFVILILVLMIPSCLAREGGGDPSAADDGGSSTSIAEDGSPADEGGGSASGKEVESGASASGGKAEWTILYYFGADCDLEASMLDNLKQILEIGSSAKVNVVMLADRSPNKDEEEGYCREGIANLKGWSTAKLLYVEKNHLKELGDWGVTNLGDGAVLKKFLEWGMSRYPAKRYALLFSDHGAGWSGVSADEHPEDDMLTLDRITRALDSVKGKYGSLEMIGFDACLMGTLEVACALRPYAKVMIASEETEPGDGWSYTPVMKTLVSEPTMDGAALGRLIAANYRDYFLNSADKDLKERGKTITLSVISLEKIGEVSDAVDRLSKALIASMKGSDKNLWKEIGKARSGSETYGLSSDPADSYYLVDLGHLASILKKNLNDPAVGKACEELFSAVKGAVSFSIHGSSRPNSHGLSIYFPPYKKVAEDIDKYRQISFVKSTSWGPFIDSFLGLASTGPAQVAMGPVSLSERDVENGKTITVKTKVSPEDVDEAYFVLAQKDGDDLVVIGQEPADISDDGVLKEEWNGCWFTLEDAKQVLICPISAYEEVENSDRLLLCVPAKVRYKGTQKWSTVTLRFDYAEKNDEIDCDLLSASLDTKFGIKDIDLKSIDAISPLYLIRGKDGSEKFEGSDDKEDILTFKSSRTIKVSSDMVPPGKYMIGFRVIDLSGKVKSDLMEVTVK